MSDTKELPVLAQVKSFMTQKDIKERFERVLGQKAPQFMASLVNVVASSPQLQKVDSNSIMSAAFVAASFDLPIDSNLGFSAIVPYKDKAQFQMMYKGFIQLAIRSGQYEKMSCSVIYEDELKSYNPITGEIAFNDFSGCQQRNAGADDKIVGYYALFKLISGFTSELYMSKAEIQNHARKYSKSYQYDIQQRKSSSKWSTDFDAMAKKTVIKLLLSRWGILSVDMQRAIADDQKVYDNAGNGGYFDNEKAGNTPVLEPAVIDAFAMADKEAAEETERSGQNEFDE